MLRSPFSTVLPERELVRQMNQWLQVRAACEQLSLLRTAELLIRCLFALHCPFSQVNAPPVIQAWLHQHAEPLLSHYLEQWMTVNATTLLTHIVNRQQQMAEKEKEKEREKERVFAAGSSSVSSPAGGNTPTSPSPFNNNTSSSMATAVYRPLYSSSSSASVHAAGAHVPSSSGAAAMAALRSPPSRLSSLSGGGGALASAHRPLGLGLGLGRSSPDHSLSPIHGPMHAKGPLAEVLQQAASPLAPGEEASSSLSAAAAPSAHSPTHQSHTLQQHPISASILRRSSQTSAGGGSERIPSLGLGPGAGAGAGTSSLSSVLQQPNADVLLVEDVRVAQRLAHVALTRAHYRVEIASSGEMALDKYRAMVAQPYPSLRVILMDISLPGISGVEVTERIRRMEAEAASAALIAGNQPASPVYIYGLTATVDPEDLSRYQRAGMNGCILKGKVLADSVKLAVEESERGTVFVNMTEKHETTSPTASSAASVTGLRSASPQVSSSRTPPPLSSVLISRLSSQAGSRSPLAVPMQVSAPASPVPSSPNSSATGSNPSSTAMGPLPTPDFSMLSMASPSPMPLIPGASMGGHLNGGSSLMRAVNSAAALAASYPGATATAAASSVASAAATNSPPPLHHQPLSLQPKRIGIGIGGTSGLSREGSGGAGSPQGLSGSKRPLSVMQDTPMVQRQVSPVPLHAAYGAASAAAAAAAAAGGSGMSFGAAHAPWVSSPASSAASIASSSPPAAGGIDVLLVEDVRVAQRIAARALTNAHYRVDVASNGEAAVEKFKALAQTLRIVLMDINLPGGITGTDATVRIRAHEAALEAAALAAGVPPPPRVLVLGLTGNVDEDNLRLYEAAGMNGCIGKGKQLGEAVQRAIQMHAANPHVFVNLAGPTAAPSAGHAASAAAAAAAAPSVSSIGSNIPSELPSSAASGSAMAAPPAASSSSSSSSPSSAASSSERSSGDSASKRARISDVDRMQ